MSISLHFVLFLSIADWYTTFCHLAGVPYIDLKAAEANVKLADSHPSLPLLPPVDGRNQWEAIISGTKCQPSNVNIRSDYLHLSPETVIKYPWKLITVR